MFKILDRYLIGQFLKTYIFVVLVLLAVVGVIDYSEKTDDFLKQDIPLEETVFDYFLNFLLYVANLITPLIIFIAAVFVTARLASRTEIIAMLASGLSLGRILRPHLIGAGLVALVTFGINGWVMPHANERRVNFDNAYFKKPFFFDDRNIHVRVDEGLYAYMQSYNNNNLTGYKFTLEKLDDFQLKARLEADVIKWDSTAQAWKLPRYKLHTFEGEKESFNEGTNLDTVLNMSPKDFESKHLLQETLTNAELDQYLEAERAKGNTELGAFLVEKYQRQSAPFAIIIMTIMGVIVASRKSRQGTSVQIAVGFGLAFAFLITFIIFRSMGQAQTMLPALAVWMPNLIFGGITLFLYYKTPK